MRDQNRMEGIQIPLISCKKPSSSSIRQSSQNREGMNIFSGMTILNCNLNMESHQFTENEIQ